MKTRIFAAFISLTMFPLISAATPIFKSYQFGSSYGSYEKQPAFQPCDLDGFDQGLCGGTTTLGGVDFDVQLGFMKNQLVAVNLVAPFVEDSYATVNGLMMRDFYLTRIRYLDESKDVDIFRFAAQTRNHDAYRAGMSEFMANAADESGGFIHVFWEAPEGLVQRISPRQEFDLTSKLSSGARRVLFSLWEDDSGPYMELNFNIPKMQSALAHKQRGVNPNEKF